MNTWACQCSLRTILIFRWRQIEDLSATEALGLRGGRLERLPRIVRISLRSDLLLMPN